MKILFTFFWITIFFCSNSCFSIPLNGTYTIGVGGNYTTINSAVSALLSQGVSGPVIFDIITGIYNENVVIAPGIIPGSSIINITTFKSQAGNTDSVSVRSFLIGTSYLNITKLKITNHIHLSYVSYIGIINNDLNNSFIFYTGQAYCHHIAVDSNKNIGLLLFDDIDFGDGLNNIRITNNFITATSLRSLNSHVSTENISIENNTIGNLYIYQYTDVNIYKNKISGGLSIIDSDNINLINNFIIAPCDSLQRNFIQFNNNIKIFFNTFKNSCFNNATLLFFNTNATALNNLFINFSGVIQTRLILQQ